MPEFKPNSAFTSNSNTKSPYKASVQINELGVFCLETPIMVLFSILYSALPLHFVHPFKSVPLKRSFHWACAVKFKSSIPKNATLLTLFIVVRLNRLMELISRILCHFRERKVYLRLRNRS